MSSTAISSGALAVGTTTLVTGRAFLNSIQLIADGTNACSVIVYDDVAGSGKILLQLSLPAAGLDKDFRAGPAIRADIGLTVVVAGTGARAIVNHGAV